MSKGMRYPCRRCRRVEDPVSCENRNCYVWGKWFCQKWEKTCKLFEGEKT